MKMHRVSALQKYNILMAINKEVFEMKFLSVEEKLFPYSHCVYRCKERISLGNTI